MVDPTLVRLANMIQNGWPESGKDLPIDIKPYFQHQYKLHVVYGIIFLKNRIMVPIGLKCQFLTKLHKSSHLGVVKSKLLARTLVYWPRWSEDIKQVCAGCEVCCENQHMPLNTPSFTVKANYPGEVYGMDIAEINGRQHLVLVDYKSCCIFERELSSLHTSEIVKALKSIFCDVGTPGRLISDNATYFKSETF